MKHCFTSIVAAAVLSANVAVMAQEAETPNYYVVAQGSSTERTINAGSKDGNGRDWYGYNGTTDNFTFSLKGCKPADLYLEFDLYVESPFAEDGLAFPGVVWGGNLPDGKTEGKMEPQNYLSIKLNGVAAWEFANNPSTYQEAFGEILDECKNGEWNHLVFPFANSPRLAELNVDAGDFTGINVNFMRMKSNEYVFKVRNFRIVDHSRQVVTEKIPVAIAKPYVSTLGGDTKTSVYITIELDHVDLTGYSNAAFNFVADIAAVDGENDPELLGNITGDGGQGCLLASKPASELGNNWGKEAAGRYDIKKTLDWQFGEHTYTVPVSSMNNQSVVDWSDLVVARLYIYDDVLTLDPVKVTFSEFYFTGEKVEDVDDGTTGIDAVAAAGGDMNIVVLGDVITVAGADNADIAVYNISGTKVAGARGTADLSALAAGVYVVTAREGAKHVVAKIMK